MDMQRSDDMPSGARAALHSRYSGRDWALVHAWIDDDTVLAVTATAPEAAFDEGEDAFDVDAVELHLLRVFDDLQGGWEVVADHELPLSSLFEDLVQSYLDRTEPPGGGPA